MNTEYKYAYFGNSSNSEKTMLDFIDNNWSKIISFGHSEVMEAETFEVPGWYARYAKASITSDTAKISKKVKKDQ